MVGASKASIMAMSGPHHYREQVEPVGRRIWLANRARGRRQTGHRFSTLERQNSYGQCSQSDAEGSVRFPVLTPQPRPLCLAREEFAGGTKKPGSARRTRRDDGLRNVPLSKSAVRYVPLTVAEFRPRTNEPSLVTKCECEGVNASGILIVKD